MRKHEFISHVADVRLKLEADTSQELFLAGLEGMNNLLKQKTCNNDAVNKTNKTIEISSVDQTSLLIDFLSEVLTYSQINKAVYSKVEFEKLDENFLKAKIFGQKVNFFNEDIKAVTYHEAQIQKNKSGNLETVIIFDI